jgi:hypothetical protein
MTRVSARRTAIVAVAVVLSLQLVGASVPPTWASFSHTTGNAANVFTASTSYYRSAVLADSPVAYWRLGEPSGATTATNLQGAGNGTYTGGVILGQPSALVNDADTSVDFNGTTGLVNIPTPVPAALRFDVPLSIEAWVNLDTTAGTRWIVNRGTFYYLYFSAGTTYFGVRTPAGAYIYVTTLTVTAGSWQHLVGTYDGTTFILYRNGSEVVRAAITGTVTKDDAVLKLADLVDGRVDEVALYNKVLNPARVLEHYERGALTRP